LVDAAKVSLHIEEHQVGDFFSVSENIAEWVSVRSDLAARETALCTMLLSTLAVDGSAECVRLAYNCTTLPPRGEKPVIALGFNVAFGNKAHAEKDVEKVEATRGEKLVAWRNARNGVGTSLGTTPATATAGTSGGTDAGTGDDAEVSL
jgi:hypothetical protein